MTEMWRRFVAAAGGSVDELEGAVVMHSGIPIAMFNPAFVIGDPPDAPAVIAAVGEHFAERRGPFAVYFRDAVAPRLAEACAAAGLVEHWQPPLMVLDPIPEEDPPTPDGVTIETVEATNYDTYLATLCAGFGMPAELIAPFEGGAMLNIAGFTGLIGRLDGRPVAASAVFVHEDTAGVYNVATVPDHRGKGIGAAVTTAAARAGAAGGAQRSILQASEAGQPVYTRLGYATPTRYRQFEPGG